MKVLRFCLVFARPYLLDKKNLIRAEWIRDPSSLYILPLFLLDEFDWLGNFLQALFLSLISFGSTYNK